MAPLGGAVTGFAKTYKRSGLDALVKAGDSNRAVPRDEIAALLIGETERYPGVVEAGYRQGLRWMIGLREEPVADGQRERRTRCRHRFRHHRLGRSIVSAITAGPRRRLGRNLYLLDVAPELILKNPDLGHSPRIENGPNGNCRRGFSARRTGHAGARGKGTGRDRNGRPRWRTPCRRCVPRRNGELLPCGPHRRGGRGQRHPRSPRAQRAYRRPLARCGERSAAISCPDKDPREFDLVFDVKRDAGSTDAQHRRDAGRGDRWCSVPSRAGSATRDRRTTAQRTIC